MSATAELIYVARSFHPVLIIISTKSGFSLFSYLRSSSMSLQGTLTEVDGPVLLTTLYYLRPAAFDYVLQNRLSKKGG